MAAQHVAAGRASAEARRKLLGEDGLRSQMAQIGKRGGRPTLKVAVAKAWEKENAAQELLHRKGPKPK